MRLCADCVTVDITSQPIYDNSMAKSTILDTPTRSIRINPTTHKNLLAASKYFKCHAGDMVTLLLNAASICPITKNNSKLANETVNRFYKEMSVHSENDTYLFSE